MLLNIIEKSKVSLDNLWDKLQFVNSVKRLVLDLTKILFLKRLIGISRFIVEVLNDQKLFTESNLANWFRVKADFLSWQKLLATIFFSKEISLVIIAAMVLAPNFYWKNCLRVISVIRGNPPLCPVLLRWSFLRTSWNCSVVWKNESP